MTDTNHKHWYVLRAIFRKEETVRDKLRRAGFRCYVPMCYHIVTERGHKVRHLTPAITELVFVYGTEENIKEFKLHSKETIYWLTKPKGDRREKIVVADKAMEDFICFTQQNEQSVTYFHPNEVNLNKGDHIIIHGGAFDGVEGILLKVKGKREKQMMVSIPGIITAAVCIKPEMVELLSRRPTKSTNPSRDVKELIRLTTQMLTSPPSRIEQATEWDMLYDEIQRLYESLKSLQAYLPTMKGEMALSLVMAEKVLFQSVTSTTRQRFLNAFSCLGEQTLLGVRMKLIGGIILPDDTLLSKARHTLTLWHNNPTDRQRSILTEAELFTEVI